MFRNVYCAGARPSVLLPLAMAAIAGCASALGCSGSEHTLSALSSNGDAAADGRVNGLGGGSSASTKDASAERANDGDTTPPDDASAEGDGPEGDATGTFDACIPSAVEDCSNGIDDDCNGKADCADLGCAQAAHCMPTQSDVAYGTLVDDANLCPIKERASPLHKGLQSGTCGGCACSVGDPSCQTAITVFKTPTDCVTGFPGTYYPTLDGTPKQCSTDTSSSSSYYYRTDLTTTLKDCAVAGTPHKVPAHWQTNKVFCGGASPVADGKQCALIQGSKSCPAGYGQPDDTWYAGLVDSQTCPDRCSCQVDSPGNCNSFSITVDAEGYCSDQGRAVIKPGDRDCSNSYYVPAFQYIGAVTPSKCSASAPIAGSVSPKDGYTVCCPGM